MKDNMDALHGDLFAIPNASVFKLKIDGILIPVDIRCELVGMIKGECILVSHPTPLATTKPKLFPGNRVIAQYQYEDKVLVFGVQIKAFLSRPVKILVLDYPDKLIRRRLKVEG